MSTPTLAEKAQDAASSLATSVAQSLNLQSTPSFQNGATTTLYIDEKAGSDDTGTGAELSPFATPLAAYQFLSPPPTADANPSSIVTLMVRKTDSVERNEWVEMSASARKRLVKGIEGWRKKEAKRTAEGDKAERDRLETEEREHKRREEAKGVVLVDDPKQESKRVRGS